jgi:hypothetical protein
LHLLLSNRIREAGEAGREVIEHGQTCKPTRKRIAPLRKLRIRKPGKDLRDEEKRSYHREHGDYSQEELHAIANEQTKVARHECEYASRK